MLEVVLKFQDTLHYCCVDVDADNAINSNFRVELIKKHAQDAFYIPIDNQRLLYNGYNLEGDDVFFSDGFNDTTAQDTQLHHVDVCLKGQLKGGKGGFGQMLKSLGARASNKETTNYEACRSLDGRRVRDLHEEERVAKYLAVEPERKALAEEKKRTKQEKILRGPIHKFDHQKLGAETREIKNAVDDALLQGLKHRKVGKNGKNKHKSKRQKISNIDTDSDSMDDGQSSQGSSTSSVSHNNRSRVISTATSSSTLTTGLLPLPVQLPLPIPIGGQIDRNRGLIDGNRDAAPTKTGILPLPLSNTCPPHGKNLNVNSSDNNKNNSDSKSKASNKNGKQSLKGKKKVKRVIGEEDFSSSEDSSD